MDLIGYIVILIISIATLVYWYFKVSFSKWKKRNIPHVEPSFPFGNMKGFGRSIHASHALQKIYNQLKGKDKLGGTYFFTSAQLMVLDLETTKNILIKDFSNFIDRGIFYNEKVCKRF